MSAETTSPWFWPPARHGGVADTDRQPAWLGLDIPQVAVDGAPIAVRETTSLRTPFYRVISLTADGRETAPRLLLVMPMSGHFARILRDLAIGLLTRCRVDVLTWTNARYTPLEKGAFGFADNISAVAHALRTIGPGAHLVGLCQGAPVAMAAAVGLHQGGDPARPASLALLGGPIDPAAPASRISSILASTPIPWLERYAIALAPQPFPGAGRRVYPARTHQNSLLTHLARHFWKFGPLAEKVRADDGADPERHPFLTDYTRVKDIPADAFLESLEAIYQKRALATGELRWEGALLRPSRVRHLPLLTVEAEDDDIAAPGQTRAAHDLFAPARAAERRHLSIPGGHFSLAHGVGARRRVAAALSRFAYDFLARLDGAAQRPRATARTVRTGPALAPTPGAPRVGEKASSS